MGRPGSEHRSMLRRSRSLLIDSLPCRLQDYILHLYGSIDVMGRGGAAHTEPLGLENADCSEHVGP